MTQRDEDRTSPSLRRRLIAALRDFSQLRASAFDKDLAQYLAGRETHHDLEAIIRGFDAKVHVPHGLHGGVDMIKFFLNGTLQDFTVSADIKDKIDGHEYRQTRHLIVNLFPEYFSAAAAISAARPAPPTATAPRRRPNP